MFTAVLFTIAKIQNQTKCLSIDEEIKNLCYIYTMEYNSALTTTKKKTPSFVTACMNLKNI
jgi:hypothetical protein